MAGKRARPSGVAASAPKAKKAAKVGSALASDVSGSAPPRQYATASMNAHMVEVGAACTTIFGNEHFNTIRIKSPLSISLGGKEPPYSFDACKDVHTKDTSKGTALNAGGNFFWQGGLSNM